MNSGSGKTAQRKNKSAPATSARGPNLFRGTILTYRALSHVPHNSPILKGFVRVSQSARGNGRGRPADRHHPRQGLEKIRGLGESRGGRDRRAQEPRVPGTDMAGVT